MGKNKRTTIIAGICAGILAAVAVTPDLLIAQTGSFVSSIFRWRASTLPAKGAVGEVRLDESDGLLKQRIDPSLPIFSQGGYWLALRPSWGFSAMISASSSTRLNIDLGSWAVFQTSNLFISSFKAVEDTSDLTYIPCVSGTSPTGSLCIGVNETLGISFIPRTHGLVEVCASFTFYMESTNTLWQHNWFKLARTEDDSYTITEDASNVVSAYIRHTTSGEVHARPEVIVCEEFTADSYDRMTIRLFGAHQDNGGGHDGIQIDSGNLRVKFTVKPL